MKKLIALLLLSPLAFAETYSNSAYWSGSSAMTLTEKKFFGLTTSVSWDVSTNKTSITVGDEIKVYDNKNKLYKVFKVNVIAKDKNGDGINSCWISWLNTKRPSEYLSIVNCK
jgi:hypothetical protein